MKKLEEGKRTGSEAKSFRKYIYSESMSFLQKNTAKKETVSSVVEDDDEGETRKNDEINCGTPTLPDKRGAVGLDQPSTSTQGRGKRQKTAMTDIENCILAKLQEPEDRHVSFFKGILPTLQKFNDTETIQFQGEVIKTIQSIHRLRQTPRDPPSCPTPSEHSIQSSPHMYPYYPEHVKHTQWRHPTPFTASMGNSYPATQPVITVPSSTPSFTPIHSPQSVQSSTSAHSGDQSQLLDIDFAQK